MVIYRNYATGSATNRRGEKHFTSESFYDLANRLIGQHQMFAMWLGYGQEFYDHVSSNNFSARGWNGSSPAYFADVPIDFDASDNLEAAYEQTLQFIHNELLGRGIDERYFAIYLSGGKGFHVHISSSCFNVEQPCENAGHRIKAWVTSLKAKYSRLDLSVYNATALFRLPGSQHKSGLYKTEIPLERFTSAYVARAHEWAKERPTRIRVPEQRSPAVRIELPDYRTGEQDTVHEFADFDDDAVIVPNCPWLQKVLDDPSGKGRDGDGRERRRNAVGVLLSAHPTSSHNAELQQFVDQLFQHPYMNEGRREDVAKWIREYDRDGEIKCKKLCRTLGCSSAQVKICGTKSPLDWKLKSIPLETISVEDARAKNTRLLESILLSEQNSVNVLNWPVGIGKTFTLLNKIAEHRMTAFYVAQTHLLSAQTHDNFLEEGLDSRHIASRQYLAENQGFECLHPAEVQLAMENGYGSHTVCAKCPRKRKTDREAGTCEPDEGYTACDYFEQFEQLEDVQVVVGVHNHLMDYMYDAADVHERTVTVIDESPLEVFSNVIKAIEPRKLELIRKGFASYIQRIEVGGQRKEVKPRPGMFGRVRAFLEQQAEDMKRTENLSKLPTFRMFQQLYEGQAIDLEFLVSLDNDYLRACWYEIAGAIAIETGLAASSDLSEELAFLCIPFPVSDAVALMSHNKTYDPAKEQYVPIRLPDNKVVILDATASNDVYAPVIAHLNRGFEERQYKFFEHPFVEQKFCHVVQIINSSYGVRRLFHDPATGADDPKRELLEAVRILYNKSPGRSLLVCHKTYAAWWKKELERVGDFDVAHYGSLKGLNNWENCVNQFIIGTPFVPDHGVQNLAERLGQEVELHHLVGSQATRRMRLRAKDGTFATASRRFYNGYPFHNALAQMKSRWEVTQAVRLRLYNDPGFKQQLYIFSNVDLKGMYADEFMTLHELIYKTTKETQAAEDDGMLRELEQNDKAVFAKFAEWYGQQAVGTLFKRSGIPPIASDSYLTKLLMALAASGKIEKSGLKWMKRYEL